MVFLFLVFEEPPYCFLQWLYQFTFPSIVLESSSKTFSASIEMIMWVFFILLMWCFTLINFLMFIYLLLIIFYFRERKSEQGRGGEKENLKQNLKLSMEPDMGFNPMTLGSCLKLKSRVRCSTDWTTQAPLFIHFWERERVGVHGCMQVGEGQRENFK